MIGSLSVRKMFDRLGIGARQDEWRRGQQRQDRARRAERQCDQSRDETEGFAHVRSSGVLAARGASRMGP